MGIQACARRIRPRKRTSLRGVTRAGRRWRRDPRVDYLFLQRHLKSLQEETTQDTIRKARHVLREPPAPPKRGLARRPAIPLCDFCFATGLAVFGVLVLAALATGAAFHRHISALSWLMAMRGRRTFALLGHREPSLLIRSSRCFQLGTKSNSSVC
jgi:hypothetical protein